MEQRVIRLKSCLAHMQRQFGHITAMPMTAELRDSLGELWQYIIHMQLEVAAMERQLQVQNSSSPTAGHAVVTSLDEPIPVSPSPQHNEFKAPHPSVQQHTGSQAGIPDPIAPQPSAPQPTIAPNPTQPRRPPEMGRQGATRLDAGTVLVIDDCQNTQNILSFSLGSEGVHVTSLTEPERWAQTVRKVQPRVILLDLMMPRLDGFEVLRQLRATKDFDSIFVVVGSSRSFEHDRLTVLGMGADDFIPKPYHIKELALKFSNLIRSVRRYS